MDKSQMSKYKLCYVHGNKAYFTSEDLSNAWWNDWIRNPSLAKTRSIPEENEKNVTSLYFEVQEGDIIHGDPNRATFTSQMDFPWFSYWATGYVEGHESIVYVEVLSGMPMDEFVKTIISDGGKIYELSKSHNVEHSS